MDTYEKELKTKHAKIVSFYRDHPSIDFEKANLLLIDFLDSMFNHVTNDLDSNINSQILSYMATTQNEIRDIKSNVSNITDSMSKINEQTVQTMNSQLQTIKSEYIDEVRSLNNSSNMTTSEKLSNIVEKNSAFILDKTTILLNDIIPRTSDSEHTRIREFLQLQMSELHKQIAEDTTNIAKSSNGEHFMKNFLDSFEGKYNTMVQTIQQPMFSYVSASEERLTSNINSVKDLSTSSLTAQKSVFDELNLFLNKYNMSSNKGKYGESNLCSVLNELFPSAEVQDTTGTKASGDFIVKRMDKSPVLVETKEYNHNVNKEEIAKFIRDIDTQNMNGIFVSQYSGITFKNNYHIDIHKGNILVYVQHCEYSPDKLRIAFDIIDYLSNKVQELNTNETNNITKEVLDDINQEYQTFITQRETLQMTLKDFQKRMNSQIDSLKLPALDKYLDTKYAYVQERSFTCDMCNAFTGSNKQSLSAHKRGCKKKHQSLSNTVVSEENA